MLPPHDGGSIGNGVSRMKRSRLSRKSPIRAIALKRSGASRSVIQALDDIAKALCKLRAGGLRIDGGSMWVGPCARCGKHGTLQWAHFIGRRCHRTRWEADNGDALDGGCHMKFDQKLENQEEWKLNQIGVERVQRLRDRLNGSFRIDYEATLVALKQDWLMLTGERWR